MMAHYLGHWTGDLQVTGSIIYAETSAGFRLGESSPLAASGKENYENLTAF